MNIKIVIPLTALSLVAIMWIYFLINPSYKISLEAKYHYEIGEYSQAYVLAKEAFGLNVYNRMAATIMAQSKISMKYEEYIKSAKKYMLDINEIATHESISDADRAKIRTICEIMISSYTKLAPSVITDKELVTQVSTYYKEFENLLEKVDK
jgi:tRNA U34 5-carboxymethylaminomethyl modifying enzyme MnmG/GidA